MDNQKQAFGYRIEHGVSYYTLYSSIQFIIFSDNKKLADDYIKRYVTVEVEKDKYINDDGELVNQWWNKFGIKEVPIKDFNNDSVNIVWI